MKRKVSVGSDRALLPVLPKERKQRSDHHNDDSDSGGGEEGIEDVLVDKELMFLIFGPDLFTWKDLPVLASVCRYHHPPHLPHTPHHTSPPLLVSLIAALITAIDTNRLGRSCGFIWNGNGTLMADRWTGVRSEDCCAQRV